MEPHKELADGLSSVAGENMEEHPLILNNSAPVDDYNHDIENPQDPLLKSLRKKLERWHPLSSDHSICKVPKQLLSKNPSAYVPKLVSIGPLHHGRIGLEDMEEYKQRFLAEFLQRAQISLVDYIAFFKQREGKLRVGYVDTIALTSVEFLEIVMVDAAFVVLLLVKHAKGDNDECCRIFMRPCHLFNIMEDMLLLENQLPWFILEDLYNYAKIKIESITSFLPEEISFLQAACDFINYRGDLGVTEYDLKKIENQTIAHFLDCLWKCHMSSKEDSPERTAMESACLPTVSELHQAGVQFAKSPSTNLFKIEFKNGVLSIPYMFMGDSTETIYRNLLAFEQCFYAGEYQFTDYFSFMDQIISSPKDIDLLVESGIIENTLGNSEQAAIVFNNLAQGLAVGYVSYFGDISNQLRTYYGIPWHKWKAMLRHDYFNNPWAGISVIAAVILLVLTVMQTVYGILSYE